MKKFNVLVVHCAYQLQGGEDLVVDAEVALMREMGHDVRVYLRRNDDIQHMPVWQVARDTIWSPQTLKDLRAVTNSWRPDIIHVHNTTLLISPSIFWAAAELGIPVVQTLHNFRTACLSATFLREGKVCEDCLGKAPLAGIARACYRGSKAQSAVLASSIMTHRWRGTYQRKVNRFITLTRFARDKVVASGLPANRIDVKPNFVPITPPPPPTTVRQGGLFVGRLSVEKGIETLLAARRALPHEACPIEVLGTGPLDDEVLRVFGAHHRGHASIDAVLSAMRKAAFLLLPSVCYEGGFPRTAIEAFSCGTPVIASRLGSMAEFIEHGHNGLLFEAGNAEDLANCIRWATEHPTEMARMGHQARAAYEQHFTPAGNYVALMGIYQQAIDEGALTT